MWPTPRNRRRWRPARTSRSARRTLAWLVSMGCGAAAVVLLAVGLIGWLAPRQEPVQIQRGVGIQLAATPVFDAGATVFAAPGSSGVIPTPAALECSMGNGEHMVPALSEPPQRLGSRVREGLSIQPVLDLGRPGSGDRLICGGAYLDYGAAWVLPTRPARSSGGMAMVIGAIGCLGLSLLTNPDIRGFTPR